MVNIDSRLTNLCLQVSGHATSYLIYDEGFVTHQVKSMIWTKLSATRNAVAIVVGAKRNLLEYARIEFRDAGAV